MSEKITEGIWCLGDPHICGDIPWHEATIRKIIQYIDKHPLNIPTIELILTGDLIDRFKGLPPSHDLLVEFLSAFRVKKIHVIVGNHDVDKLSELNNKIKKDGQVVAYSHIRHTFKKVQMYEYPSYVEIAGLKTLFLPYYKAPTHCLEDYNNPEVFYKRFPNLAGKKYDLVVGHIMDIDCGLPPNVCVDVKALLGPDQNPLKIFGHLHKGSVSNDSVYLGSLYSLRSDEKGDRYESLYSTLEKKWYHKKLPTFCELLSVKFGEPLPKPTHDYSIPVYTIYNCFSEEKALKLYGSDTHIRKVISSWDYLRKNNELSVDPLNVEAKAFIAKKDLVEAYEKEIRNNSNMTEEEDEKLSIEALKIIKNIMEQKDKEEAATITN